MTHTLPLNKSYIDWLVCTGPNSSFFVTILKYYLTCFLNCLMHFVDLHAWMIAVSFAKITVRQSWEIGISAVCKIYCIGPSTLPCDAPKLIGTTPACTSLYLTVKNLYFRQNFNILYRLNGTHFLIVIISLRVTLYRRLAKYRWNP